MLAVVIGQWRGRHLAISDAGTPDRSKFTTHGTARRNGAPAGLAVVALS